MELPLIFAPQASRPFAERVAAAAGTSLAPMEEREFEGGEHKSRPLVSVRDRPVWVVQSLAGDEAGSANDRLCRALFLIAALKDCGAARVTACLPYLAYGRKDRRTKERDPVTTRYVAQLFEAVGTDHVVGLDAHNLAAFENAFRCPVDHLEAAPLMASYLAKRADAADVCIVSPDFGGAKRAQRLQELLAVRTGREVAFAIIDKRRSSGVVSGGRVPCRRLRDPRGLPSGGRSAARSGRTRSAGRDRLDPPGAARRSAARQPSARSRGVFTVRGCAAAHRVRRILGRAARARTGPSPEGS